LFNDLVLATTMAATLVPLVQVVPGVVGALVGAGVAGALVGACVVGALVGAGVAGALVA
jgi:hypothetical protein